VRPWIEFVQSQKLPWQSHDPWGVRRGVEIKALSHDDESGAASLLVRYPASFSAPAGSFSVDEEFLVLEGSLLAGPHRYGHLGYAHWPAGYRNSGMSSPDGAVVLTFLSGVPKRVEARDFRADRLVEKVDAYHVSYTGNFHPQFPPGAGRKKLFEDPITHDTSWLLGTLPLRWSEAAEVHPTVEEMYLITGETHGNRGVMRPGAYFWRPAGAPHGPYGTLTGNLYFFRTKGGPLATDYVAPAQSFQWWPKYNPVIPEHLAAFRGEVPPGPNCW
jgi:Domain of unknown function (DUF4437)